MLTIESLKHGLKLIQNKYGFPWEVEAREFWAESVDGYGSPDNRSIFFCLKGSPNKVCGFVRRASLSETGQNAYIIETNFGKFYFYNNWVSKTYFTKEYGDLRSAVPKKWHCPKGRDSTRDSKNPIKSTRSKCCP